MTRHLPALYRQLAHDPLPADAAGVEKDLALQVPALIALGTGPASDPVATHRALREATVARAMESDLLQKPQGPIEARRLWRDIAKRHNVRRLTGWGLVAVALDLYEAGLIDTADYLRLAYQPEVFDPEATPDAARYLTPAFADGTRDWVAEFEAMVRTGTRHGGTPARLTAETRLLRVLHKLDASRTTH